MVTIIALPILVLLIVGFLSLIVYAIVRKKWALLFIPLGLVMLCTVFLGLYSFAVPTIAEYKDNYPYSTVEYPANNTSNVRQYGVEVSRSNDSGKNVRTIHVNSKNGNSVLVSKQNGNSTVHVNSSNGSVEVTRNQSNASHGQIRYKTGMISIVLLIGLLALVVLVVIAIICKKWALLFIPLGVGALAFIGLFTLKVEHVSPPSESQTAVADHPRMIEDVPDKPLPAVWSPGMEKEFKSSTYYSKTAALSSIADRVDEMVRQMVLNGQVIPEEMALFALKDKPNQEMIDKAIEIFREVMPETKFIEVPAGKQTFTKDDNWISFDLSESLASMDNHYVKGHFNKADFLQGNIKASIHLKGRTVSMSPHFVTKPWLENFSAFQSSTPQRQFAIAYSQTSCNSLEWAVKQATSQAQQIVNRMILDIHRSMPKPRRGRGGFSLSREDLFSSGIIVDNFNQHFSSNVGIYRHAFLLDISPDRIMPLAEKKIRGYNAARQSWAYHIMSAIGIALVICVIYLILNAATKGYYTVVLRILTVIGIIAVVLLLTMV